jgi:hypothetical protein
MRTCHPDRSVDTEANDFCALLNEVRLRSRAVAGRRSLTNRDARKTEPFSCRCTQLSWTRTAARCTTSWPALQVSIADDGLGMVHMCDTETVAGEAEGLDVFSLAHHLQTRPSTPSWTTATLWIGCLWMSSRASDAETAPQCAPRRSPWRRSTAARA